MQPGQCIRGAWQLLPRPLAILLLATLPASGQIALIPPIACDLGAECYIQNHVDHDPGPGHRDFACGHLGYDGHDGTDFALATLAQMRAGVAVLAPAAGTVRAIRDGMADIAANAPNAPDRQGRDCGNAVVIDHANGYSSQLCHLARGSVLVRSGDQVAAGQTIGQVGLSGLTEFPHVHMTLRQNGHVVDPFRPERGESCETIPGRGLWAEPLAYVPAMITGIGLATAPPDHATVLDGLATPDSLPANAPALILWAAIFGPAAGDQLTLRLTGPAGTVFATTEELTRNQARAFRFAGKRLPATGWPPGAYLAEAELTRQGRRLHQQRQQVTLTP